MALYSEKYNYLFIHIYRTGGNAMRSRLYANKHCKEVLHPHATAFDCKILFEKRKMDFNKVFKFAFVRNPYEWVFSIWALIQTDKTHFLYKDACKMDYPAFVKYFFEVLFCQPPVFGRPVFRPQTEYVHDDRGRLLLNYVAKTETFDNDLKEILKNMKLLYKEIPLINSVVKKNFMNWADYSDRDTIAMINEYLDKDFKTFNYKKIKT